MTSAGVDEALAEQRPEDKASAIRTLQERYGGVVTAGNGIDDALAAATVGVAPGALFGVLNLPVAVAGHELSEVVVILSGLRMARAS